MRSAWLLAAALLAVQPARANGRYPLSNQLVVGPKDASYIAVRATFGLVLSRDHGKSWHWVCEAAAQFVNGEDPPIEVTADNSVIVASSSAFTTSPDFGCNWALPESDQVIVDSDVDRSDPKRVVSSASLFDAGKYSFALRQSLDNGATWQPFGVAAEGYVLTLAIAPSQPQRIYVSTTVLGTGTPSVVRTDDDGATWHPFVLPADGGPVPYIAAIDPLDADRIYVRAPTTASGDVLFVSENAGKDWKLILQAKGTLAGFALSPDGAQIAVGGPTDPVQIASATDYAFSKVNDLGVTCLTWTSDGIFACADQATAGFSVGLSTDEGASFEPLFVPNELTLQVCDAGTPVAMSCPNAWRGLAPVIGADPATPGYEQGGGGSGGNGAGPGGSSGSADAGSGTNSADGGETTAVATGGTDSGAGHAGRAMGGSGGSAPAAPTSSDESSACSLSSPAPRVNALPWLLFGLCFGWRSRARRKSRHLTSWHSGSAPST
ncbi:MAG TPA: hypothetical protein VHB79_04790 [Polyangiaceae bacterium]|nr:hypothetical protein [Polyangiaceae bacterium]